MILGLFESTMMLFKGPKKMIAVHFRILEISFFSDSFWQLPLRSMLGRLVVQGGKLITWCISTTVCILNILIVSSVLILSPKCSLNVINQEIIHAQALYCWAWYLALYLSSLLTCCLLFLSFPFCIIITSWHCSAALSRLAFHSFFYLPSPALVFTIVHWLCMLLSPSVFTRLNAKFCFLFVIALIFLHSF